MHLFEKHDLKQSEILNDIKKSACLILLHISEDFDYRYYLREIVKADNRCQTVAAFLQKSTYQNKFTQSSKSFRPYFSHALIIGSMRVA